MVRINHLTNHVALILTIYKADLTVDGERQLVQTQAIVKVSPKPADAKYPPLGLAESIKVLPQWIQDGCGDEEYFNLEKGATFLGSHMPDNLPDLTSHNSYFAEAIKANPQIYYDLKESDHYSLYRYPYYYELDHDDHF